jgi:hypothetical protein
MATPYLPMTELTQRISKHPLRQVCITLESRISYWIPFRRNRDGKLYLKAFVYAAPAVYNRPQRIYRPYLQLICDPTDGALVAMIDCRYDDFAADIHTERIVCEIQPGDAPAATIEEVEELQARLDAGYDYLLPIAFMPVERLTQQDRESLAQFKSLFARLAVACLSDFYRALNPEFFNWLDRA